MAISHGNDINIVFLTDLHLGHPKVSAEHIFNCYKKYVVPLLEWADMLIIGGDVYDDLVTLDGRNGMFIHEFIQEIRYFAIDTKKPVRILRGTFTHDRKQGMVFDLTEENRRRGETGADMRVVDTISIEHMAKFGIDILYIPDDAVHDDFNNTIKTVLNSNKLTKVDLVVHHGYCKHMLPANIGADSSAIPSTADFNQFVRYAVLNGHVHTPSTTGLVINGGSFDRLAHNEEEPKGFFTVVLHTDTGKVTGKFIENKDATVFKTVDLLSCADDIALANHNCEEVIDALIATAETGPIFIRIITDSLEVRQAVRQRCHSKYPFVNITTQRSKIKRQTENAVIFKKLELPRISRDNLVAVLYDELEGALSKEDIAVVLKGE